MSMVSDDDQNETALPVQPDQALASVAGAPSWAEQDPVLRALWTENKTPEEISAVLNRSVAAIMTRAARLGLPRRAAPGRKRGYKRTDLSVRSAGAVRVRMRLPRQKAEAAEDDMPAPEIKLRVCLMCLNKFQSMGPHNRICPSCKGSAEYATGNSTPDFTFQVST